MFIAFGNRAFTCGEGAAVSRVSRKGRLWAEFDCDTGCGTNFAKSIFCAVQPLDARAASVTMGSLPTCGGAAADLQRSRTWRLRLDDGSQP